MTEAALGLLRRWVEDGEREGSGSAPPLPQFPSDWPLGPLDLVVTQVEPYRLAAEGRDVYRILVLPLGLKQRRYVRAVDVRPRNGSVHHALLAFDRNGVARRWDARDPEPGLPGFTLPPELDLTPHFLGWHPGKQAAEVPRGLAWTLEAGTDLVLQLHLRPTGKPEAVAPQVAFYFTSEAPTRKRPDEARAAFLDCLRLNPDHSRARGCLGVLAMESGWLDEGEVYLQEAIRFDAGDASARELLRQLRERRARGGR